MTAHNRMATTARNATLMSLPPDGHGVTASTHLSDAGRWRNVAAPHAGEHLGVLGVCQRIGEGRRRRLGCHVRKGSTDSHSERWSLFALYLRIPGCSGVKRTTEASPQICRFSLIPKPSVIVAHFINTGQISGYA